MKSDGFVSICNAISSKNNKITLNLCLTSFLLFNIAFQNPQMFHTPYMFPELLFFFQPHMSKQSFLNRCFLIKCVEQKKCLYFLNLYFSDILNRYPKLLFFSQTCRPNVVFQSNLLNIYFPIFCFSSKQVVRVLSKLSYLNQTCSSDTGMSQTVSYPNMSNIYS